MTIQVPAIGGGRLAVSHHADHYVHFDTGGHTVVAGETLSSIAAANGTTAQSIAAANGISL